MKRSQFFVYRIHSIQYPGYIFIVAVREIFYCDLLSLPKLADLLVQSFLTFFRQFDSISFEEIPAHRGNEMNVLNALKKVVDPVCFQLEAVAELYAIGKAGAELSK